MSSVLVLKHIHSLSVLLDKTYNSYATTKSIRALKKRREVWDQ